MYSTQTWSLTHRYSAERLLQSSVSGRSDYRLDVNQHGARLRQLLHRHFLGGQCMKGLSSSLRISRDVRPRLTCTVLEDCSSPACLVVPTLVWMSINTALVLVGSYLVTSAPISSHSTWAPISSHSTRSVYERHFVASQLDRRDDIFCRIMSLLALHQTVFFSSKVLSRVRWSMKKGRGQWVIFTGWGSRFSQRCDGWVTGKAAGR